MSPAPQCRRSPAGERRVPAGFTAAVLDAALDAVVLSDGNGRVLAFNPAAERLFGRRLAEATGLFMSDLIVVPPGAFASAKGGNVLGMLGERVELDGRASDGSTFPAEIAVQRVARRGRTGFAAYVRDLSAQRRAEAELAESRRRLGEIEKLSAMGSLLAGVAHELNNPLAILVAQATVLLERAPDPDVARRAGRIHDAAARAGRVVKGFLAIARQRPPVCEATDLNAVVDGTLELLNHDLGRDEIAVERDLDPRLPLAGADRDLLGQALVHLLTNARQAALDRDGGRRLSVRTRADEAAAWIEVEDDGAGVPAAIAARIFDPRFTTRPAGTALGVGLSLARAIAQAHGGDLALVPGEPGAGARFRLSLPLSAPAGAGAPCRSGLSVLVVDDEPEVAEALADVVTLLGHAAEVETDPFAAVERARDRRFDAVFVDLRMPGLDGIALLRRLARADPALASRAVITTGDTLAPTRGGEAARDLAEAIVLEKPFTVASVKAVLERVAHP